MKMRQARKTVTVRHGVVLETLSFSHADMQITQKFWVVKSYMTRKGESR